MGRRYLGWNVAGWKTTRTKKVERWEKCKVAGSGTRGGGSKIRKRAKDAVQ